MLASKFFISTSKEIPKDAELISHKLMLKAGFIKKIGNGLFTWMPIGIRVLKKIELIVRKEMDRSGALEVLMPAIQPSNIWKESGRWDLFGPQMLKIKDRHEKEYCFGPTHEEVITELAKKEINSYKQLPINFYQIQTKFRDEIRPRFGVMRSREFIMKDAYSFHENSSDLNTEYKNMYDTYTKIFNKIGLKFRVVNADPGAIGGSQSHEFHVLADSGEDYIAYCPESNYASNIELTEVVEEDVLSNEKSLEKELLLTPNLKKCEEVSKFLDIPLEKCIKSIAINNNGEFILVLIRGDHTLNESKLAKILKSNSFKFAEEKEILKNLNTSSGYIGPVNSGNIKLIADKSLASASNLLCGANKKDYHFININLKNDVKKNILFHDIRNVVEGDKSPDKKGNLKICKGIEVGHIFQLGDKYSKSMRSNFIGKDGKPSFFKMGCYGIGVSRIVAASIEQGNDERGIVWPKSITPFEVCITPINFHTNTLIKKKSLALYEQVKSKGFDVLLDDRNIRPGAMFSDIELIGIPMRITVSEKNYADEKVEIYIRKENKKEIILLENLLSYLFQYFNT